MLNLLYSVVYGYKNLKQAEQISGIARPKEMNWFRLVTFSNDTKKLLSEKIGAFCVSGAAH